jgi:hypothetical protein
MEHSFVMIHRRGDLPILDPTKLSLPALPEVAEIRTSTYLNAIGEDGLEVLVLVDNLTPEQEEDVSWKYPFEDRIRSYLEDKGEERFALILFRKVTEDGLDEEDSIGGD